MATKKSGFALPLYGVIILCIALLILSALALKHLHPKSSLQQSSVTPTLSPETSLLVDAAVWYPSAPWTEPKSAAQETYYGTLSGQSIQATVTQPNATLPHFETVSMLSEMGYQPDNNLAADGPGSSSWGYTKEANGQKQVMTFSYKTRPTSSNPNEPLQFSCPCQVDITVFVSKPFTQ